MLKNLKLAGSIAIAALLLNSSPSWAERTPFSPVVKDVPVFVIPTDIAERLELVGYALSQPVGTGIDLNSRVLPVIAQPSPTKFHVSGQNCWIKDGVLNANEPAVCRVIAARAGNPFSPITVLSTPTLFYFGTIATGTSNAQLPLPTLNVPIATLVISNNPTTAPPGTEIELNTNPTSGSVTYTELNGNTTCVITGNRLFKATSGECRIRAIKAQDGSNPLQFSQTVIFIFTD